MNSVCRIIATAGAAAALALATAGVAAAEEAEPPPSPLVEYIESWPPAPAGCNAIWDPIENAIEDSVPPQYEAEFDAFDDWCEGDAD
ncbi:hypothetical protein ACFYO7_13850 [Nocardia salmonicida]|uniref:hypothetical protein n=1 Tax=Nocardia salmonicida TaxID=53431 RepID=UPI003695BCDA